MIHWNLSGSATTCHARGGPAFDPPVEVGTAMDVDAEAAAIVVANVLVEYAYSNTRARH
jgi:hypothetical protein